MEQSVHNDDLWSVREGDTVEIVTSKGHVFEATCTNRQTENAHPVTGEIRETTIWQFDAIEYTPAVTITNGLKSREDDPDFPIHNAVWCTSQEENLGYINEITVLE